MSGAPWWVVLVAAAVGALAAIGGSVWASRVQRRSSGRAEWFRRLQWAWELTQRDDVPSVTAGMAMMEYLADATDRRDAEIVVRIAPIAREVGRLASEYLDSPADVDIRPQAVDTGTETLVEDGEPDDDAQTGR